MVSVRIKRLVVELSPGGKGMQSQDENDLFRSFVDQIRIAGNRIVHSKTMRPNVDVLRVQALFDNFRQFASMSSSIKEKL